MLKWFVIGILVGLGFVVGAFLVLKFFADIIANIIKFFESD